MKNLTGPILGLHFMRHNSAVVDTTHSLIHFLHLTMLVKNVASAVSVKPQFVLIDDALKLPPMTTKTVITFVDLPSEWSTTETVTPLENFTETASLLVSHSISTILDEKEAVRVTNMKESPYTIRQYTQIAGFSVVTPEQSKFPETMDTPLLSMITESDPALTTYLNEVLEEIKPEQQNITLWFSTLKNPGKTNITPQYNHESSKN